MRGLIFQVKRTTAQCADVVISPSLGNTPITVGLHSDTSGSHIFYAVSQLGTDPTHTGDNPGPGTIRIGNNNGSVNIGAGTHVLRALAYKNGMLDSNISEGDYEPPPGP